MPLAKALTSSLARPIDTCTHLLLVFSFCCFSTRCGDYKLTHTHKHTCGPMWVMCVWLCASCVCAHVFVIHSHGSRRRKTSAKCIRIPMRHQRLVKRNSAESKGQSTTVGVTVGSKIDGHRFKIKNEGIGNKTMLTSNTGRRENIDGHIAGIAVQRLVENQLLHSWGQYTNFPPPLAPHTPFPLTKTSLRSASLQHFLLLLLHSLSLPSILSLLALPFSTHTRLSPFLQWDRTALPFSRKNGPWAATMSSTRGRDVTRGILQNWLTSVPGERHATCQKQESPWRASGRRSWPLTAEKSFFNQAGWETPDDDSINDNLENERESVHRWRGATRQKSPDLCRRRRDLADKNRERDDRSRRMEFGGRSGKSCWKTRRWTPSTSIVFLLSDEMAVSVRLLSRIFFSRRSRASKVMSSKRESMIHRERNWKNRGSNSKVECLDLDLDFAKHSWQAWHARHWFPQARIRNNLRTHGTGAVAAPAARLAATCM